MRNLIKAIFYREWIKTRRVVLPAAVAAVFLTIFNMAEIFQQVRMSGVVVVVDNYILNAVQPLWLFKYMPMMLGLILAIAQFADENQDRRFRQTLHLPYHEYKIMTALLLYGNMVLFLCSSLCMHLMWYLASDMPVCIVGELISSTWPWFVVSHIVYMMFAATFIEPNWSKRLAMMPVLITAVVIMQLKPQAMVYYPSWWFMGLLMIVSIIAPYYNMYRFKQGK